MAANEKVKYFCNEMYATREDVEHEMKTPLISGIWKQILDYRKEYEKNLDLRHTNGIQLHVNYTPRISDRISAIERKLNSNTIAFMRLKTSLSEDYFLRESFRQILAYIASVNNVNVSEAVLDAIIDGRGEFISEEHKFLLNYYNCILHLYANPLEDIDDNTIGNIFERISGSEDLTEYYRSHDIRSSLDDMASNRPFTGVPVRMIDSLVEQLLDFCKYSNEGLFVKAVATFYFFYFIQPFESKNKEIGMLLLKKVLAYNDIESYAACIPLEKAINKEIKLASVIKNVQKDLDLTYLVVYFLDLLEPMLGESADLMLKSQEVEVKKDLYQADEEVVEDTKIEVEPEPDLFASFKTEEEKPEPVVEAKVEEPEAIPEPIIEESEDKEPEVHKEKEEIKEEPKVEQFDFEPRFVEPKVQYSQAMSIGVPMTISEEEAEIISDRLLEMDPRLSKGQAHFLARHCLVGMSYTVDQYKKELDCAYETARSSMNGLVEMGYYEKKAFRKKFVYTPIRRK